MIYLCRHGQTAFNQSGRLQGWMESDLTPLGIAQAKAMACLIDDLTQRDPAPPWRVVASPLRRARDTARIIADRLGVEVAFDDRLKEINVGNWSGLPRREVAAAHPALFASGDWPFSAPNGETYEDLMGRVSDWLSDLPTPPDRRMVVVSHGVTGRLIRGAFAQMSKADALMLDVPQDAIFRLENGRVERLDCEPVE